jgi:hypothetical protein
LWTAGHSAHDQRQSPSKNGPLSSADRPAASSRPNCGRSALRFFMVREMAEIGLRLGQAQAPPGPRWGDPIGLIVGERTLEATFARLRGASKPSRHPSGSSSAGQSVDRQSRRQRRQRYRRTDRPRSAWRTTARLCARRSALRVDRSRRAHVLVGRGSHQTSMHEQNSRGATPQPLTVTFDFCAYCPVRSGRA